MTAAAGSVDVVEAAFAGFALGVFYMLLVWRYFGPNRDQRRRQ